MSAIPNIAIGLPAGRKSYTTSMLVLAVLFLAGSGSFVYRLATAPDSLPWSFLAATFIFMLGVSQFGIAFVAIMRISRAKWARPFYRMAEIMTLAFLPFAYILFLIIYTYGRQHLFFWLSPEPGEHLSAWLNEDFLLIRNLVAQSVFYGLALVYFLMGLIPDVTEDSAASATSLRAVFYRWLWSQKKRRDNDRLKTNLYMLAPVVLIVTVIANTFISWDFAMMLFPHYHSSVFPMYFILGNMLAGTASIVILGAITSRRLKLTDFFKTVQLKSMGIVITGFALFWLYMFWAQFFVTWFGNLPYETGPLWSRMFGHYGPYFWTMMLCIAGVPIGSMIFAYTKRNWWSLLLVCAIIVAGVWLNRYLLVVPASISDHTPLSSASELLLIGGVFAGFLLVYLWLIKAFPMISEWEMRDAAGEEGPAY